MRLDKIDHERKLYVFREVGGYSCRGFEMLDKQARRVASWLVGQPDAQKTGAADAARTWLAELDRNPPGSEDHFEICANILERAQIHSSVFGRCEADLVPSLIGLEGRRVEATIHGERRRFRVGRSTGWLPCHLACHNVRSHGGDAINPDSIQDVRIVR